MNQPVSNQEAAELLPANLPLDRPRKSGFVLPPFNAQAAIEALQQMAEDADPVESQETLEYLMKALNETRAEGGERILFPLLPHKRRC